MSVTWLIHASSVCVPWLVRNSFISVPSPLPIFTVPTEPIFTSVTWLIHASFKCLPWLILFLIHIWAIASSCLLHTHRTHSCLWHDSFMPHSHTCQWLIHNAFIFAPWLILASFTSLPSPRPTFPIPLKPMFICVTWLIHNTFKLVQWLIHHSSYLCHRFNTRCADEQSPFISVTGLIYASFTRCHDAFIFAPWLIHRTFILVPSPQRATCAFQ